MNTVSEFVTATHTRIPGQPLASRTIGLKDALSIAQAIDWQRMAQIADAAREHLPSVLDELEGLRTAHQVNPERMINRALLFGIATPNRDEAISIAYAIATEPRYASADPRTLARASFPTATNPAATMGMYAALETTLSYLQRVGPRTHWSLSELEAIPGVGPKVARMITAILDPSAASWTVDLWHQRQLLWAAGQSPTVRCSVKTPGYKVLEAVWLEYAERFFPGVPVFAVQWATWNAADGKFCSHAALWDDLATSC